MNEAELAEKFNRDLDAVLAGGEAGPGSDGGALALAASLAAADHSAESSVREVLRARLVRREPALLAALRALLSNNLARAAFAAACLALALLPLLRRAETNAEKAPEATDVAVSAPLPPAGNLPPPPRARYGARPAPGSDTGLFAAVPMGRLEGERVSAFPIQGAGPAEPIETRTVKEITVPGGSGIGWETETAVFELRREPASIDDLFEVRSL